MSGRGVHFQLDDDQLAALIACTENEMPDYVANVIEEAWGANPSRVPGCETDKSWAYIHAALNGVDPDGPLVMGPAITPGFFSRIFNRTRPRPGDDARFVIMGDASLVDTDNDYIGLTRNDRVGAVASALEFITPADLANRVRQTHRRFDATGDADDAAEYAASWYADLVVFFKEASINNRHIIFSVDF